MGRITVFFFCAALCACRGAVSEAPTPVSTVEPAPIPSTPRTAEEKRAAFSEAAAAVKHERWSQARAITLILLPVYPELEDYNLHFLALSAYELDDQPTAERYWQELIARQPQSVHLPRAFLELARRALARGDLDEARALLVAARRTEDEDIIRQAMLTTAEIDIAAGNLAAAHARLMDLRGTSVGKEAKRLTLELRRRDPDLQPRGDNREREIRLLLREGDFETAQRQLQELLAGAPADQVPELLSLRADLERAAGEPERSLATLAEISRLYPNSPQAPEALYQRASRLWNSDHDNQAKGLFIELLRRYPRHRRAATARYAIGRIEQSAGNDAAAIAAYRDLARAHPRDKLADEARWRIGWIQYRAGRWQDAAETFARLKRGRSVADSAEARYWRGRALESSGRAADARREYETIAERAPDSYYAALAEQRLGERPSAVLHFAPPLFPDRIGPAPAVAHDDYHLERARELDRAGLPRMARRELRAFERANSGREITRFLIENYPVVDGYRDAIRLLGRNHPRRDRILYPAAFWSLVRRQSARNQLDPVFVLSLMRQESFFDPSARSSADARGLMQLLPSTAAAVADRHGQPSNDLDLFDPQRNVALGTTHLAELAELYGGDRVRMLAAYNAGASAVAKWDTRFGGLAQDEYVESITYRETRNYVKKILSNYRRYERMYGVPE